MKPCFDLRGKQFGKWKVQIKVEAPEWVKVNRHKAHWLCHCDCGQYGIIRSDHLRKGESKSCGCGQIKGAE